MSKRLSCKGYTLVEIVLAMLLMAVALPPLLQLFAEVTFRSAETDVMPKAVSLASELMEEIKSRKFDELAARDVTGNWSLILGSDGGETATNKNTFDDADDFNGWSQNFSGFSGYSASVTVRYVSGSDLNAPLTVPSPAPNNWTPSYKRVVLTLAHPNLPSSIQVVSVLTEIQSL